MLLSSSSFSTFLSEIGQPSTSTSKPAPVTEPPLKTESSDSGASQSTFEKSSNPHSAQVGMTLVPEPQIHYGDFAGQDESWIDPNDTSLYDAQIFAVTSVPQGPALNESVIGALSGKPSKDWTTSPVSVREKPQLPQIEFTPQYPEGRTKSSYSPDENTDDSTSFDLYASDSTRHRLALPESTGFAQIRSGKDGNSISLVSRQGTSIQNGVDAATVERFNLLCSALDDLSQSISRAIPHR